MKTDNSLISPARGLAQILCACAILAGTIYLAVQHSPAVLTLSAAAQSADDDPEGTLADTTEPECPGCVTETQTGLAQQLAALQEHLTAVQSLLEDLQETEDLDLTDDQLQESLTGIGSLLETVNFSWANMTGQILALPTADDLVDEESMDETPDEDVTIQGIEDESGDNQIAATDDEDTEADSEVNKDAGADEPAVLGTPDSN